MERGKRKSAIEFSIFLAVFFAVWTARATFFYAVDEAIPSAEWRAGYSILLKFVLWVLPAFDFAKWVRHTPPLEYLGLTARPTGRQWARSLAAIALYLAATIFVEGLLGRRLPSPASLRLPIVSVGVFSSLASPVFEEILFRGLILRELRDHFEGSTSNLLASVLFVAIHLPFWLSHGAIDAALFARCVGVFAFSLLAGWLYLKTRSVWPPVVAHIGNNLLAALLGT